MWSVRLPWLRAIFLCGHPGPFDACLHKDPEALFFSANFAWKMVKRVSSVYSHPEGILKCSEVETDDTHFGYFKIYRMLAILLNILVYVP